MSSEDAIRFEGRILERLPRDVFTVELANGHKLLAFVVKRWRARAEKLEAGELVAVEVSPYDFSTGKIVFENRF